MKYPNPLIFRTTGLESWHTDSEGTNQDNVGTEFPEASPFESWSTHIMLVGLSTPSGQALEKDI